MKPIVNSEHITTRYLNFCFLYNYKTFFKNPENLYERLHELHLQGKEERGELVYLTREEVRDFALKDNPNLLKSNISELNRIITLACFNTAALLGWKQYKQIYRFQPQLLEELWDIDFNESKYETLSFDELQFLPCYNFFVEVPMSFHGSNYVGFFVYFDTHDYINNIFPIHVLFIDNPPKKYYNGMDASIYDTFMITLAYDFNTFNKNHFEVELDNKDTTKEILKTLNPHVFQQLGEEQAMEIIIKVNQIITYLACSNCDMNRIQKPKRKPDIKRTHITDMEYEVWRLGDSYYKLANGKEINTRYLNTEEHAYAKHEIPEESDNPREPSEYIKDRRKGYHVRPHMRKAHWATFWYGKRDGSEERIKRRKFVSAVFINNTGDEIEIPTREIIKYRF